MHKLLSLLIFFMMATGLAASAQEPAPGIKWQKTFGGSSLDRISSQDTNSSIRPKVSLIDRDGKYIIAGDTWSNDGNISGNHGNGDIWVAKIDTQRNILWSACLGGSSYEYGGSIQLANDSGYIVSGSTNSTNGHVSGNHGASDIWVVRLGSTGNIIWQKCYGGTSTEEQAFIAKAGDGYILSGTTWSNDGDVSGLHGTYSDIWVAKLDNSGTIEWQKCLGGSGSDYSSVIKQTPDSGFIVTGITRSADGDVAGLHGSANDIWVVKLDKNGNIEWQKCLGGSNEESVGDIELTPAGGYVIAGLTTSSDGDVSGLHGSFNPDGWIVSLSAAGAIQWQKCFGGTGSDVFSDLLVLPDNSYAAIGYTTSVNGDVSFQHGYYDIWLVKMNNTGNKIWDKTFGGTSWEDASTVSVNAAGNFVVLGSTYSNDNDVSGNHGQDDIWLFEAGATNTIAGYVFYDANSDGIKNNNEPFFDKVTIRSEQSGEVRSAIPNFNGYYKIDVGTGSYTTQAVPYNTTYYTVVPATKTSVFNGFFNVDSVHFAVQPVPNLYDAAIYLVPFSPARPGFTMQYQLTYKNSGTAPIASGKIKLKTDSRIGFLSASPAQTTISNDTLIWNFTNLDPNGYAYIVVDLRVPVLSSTLHLSDTLRSMAFIEHGGTELTPADDTIVLKQIVIGSYDPNDKTEANAGVITPAQVNEGDYLNYYIRFQNTGTDTAFNVTVRDTLESRLDWSTLQMVGASHSYRLNIEDDNKIAWFFENIKLPDSNVNEPASHGYIAYRIKPKATVQIGDTIKNTAGIYFDYNLPVATNTSKTVVLLLSALPVTLTSFQAILNEDAVDVKWATAEEHNVHHYEILRSGNGVDFTSIGTAPPGKTVYLFKDKQPLTGYNYYRLKMVDIDGTIDYSTIVLVNVKNDNNIISSVYPNPGNGRTLNVKLQHLQPGNIRIQVLDQLGRILLTKQYSQQQAGAFKTELNLGALSKGSYLLQVKANEKLYLHTLVIQ